MNRLFADQLDTLSDTIPQNPLSPAARQRICQAACARIAAEAETAAAQETGASRLSSVAGAADAAQPAPAKAAVPVSDASHAKAVRFAPAHAAPAGKEHAASHPRRFLPRRGIALGLAAACLLTLGLAAGAVGAAGQAGLAAEGFWAALFPPAADSTADSASSLVQDNLMYDAVRTTVDGYTVTILNHMMDASGNGCVYYSVENPAGMDGFFTVDRTVTDREHTYSGILAPEANAGLYTLPVLDLADGTALPGRDYLDAERSTDTIWYLYQYFVAPASSGDLAGQSITLTMSPTAADEQDLPPEAPVITLTLPASTPVETRSAAASDGSISVQVSAIGLTVDTNIPGFVDECRYLALELADGSRYVLRDKDGGQWEDFGYCCGTEDLLGIHYVLRRVLDPAQITAVWVDGTCISLS